MRNNLEPCQEENIGADKSNIPSNCRNCQNDKTCMTYYGSDVCRDKWQAVNNC